MTQLTDEELQEAWGTTADAVSASLERFSRTARVLSSNRPRLIDQHPQQWVGLYDGAVEVVGDSIEAVMDRAKARGFPADEVIIRYIDRDEEALIL